MPEVVRVCQFCGSSFEIERWRVEQGEGLYCSHPCSAKDRKRSYRLKYQGWQVLCSDLTLPADYLVSVKPDQELARQEARRLNALSVQQGGPRAPLYYTEHSGAHHEDIE